MLSISLVTSGRERPAADAAGLQQVFDGCLRQDRVADTLFDEAEGRRHGIDLEFDARRDAELFERIVDEDAQACGRAGRMSGISASRMVATVSPPTPAGSLTAPSRINSSEKSGSVASVGRRGAW